jgi:hypothetical protein
MFAVLSPTTRRIALIMALFAASCAPAPGSEVTTPGSPKNQATSPSITASTADASPVATAIETPTPAPTHGPSPIETPALVTMPPAGQLAVWIEAFPGMLTIYDARSIATPHSFQAISEAIAHPRSPSGLAFSANSDQVAYLQYEDELTLTIADLGLTTINQTTLEDLEWLISKIERGDKIPLYWGPHDKTVLIVDPDGGDNDVLFIAEDSSIEYISNGCGELSRGGTTTGTALWCRVRPPAQGYVVLYSDGQVRRDTVLPNGDLLNVNEVAFHSNSHSSLIIDSSGKVMVLHGDSEPVETPVEYGDRLRRLPRHLYWSLDGSLALVYGNSANCPPFFNDEANEHIARPCWHILDPQTGAILWYPTDELASTLHSTWDRIDGTSYPAAISPDGLWLAMSLRESGIRYFLVISLSDSEATMVGNFAATALMWKP